MYTVYCILHTVYCMYTVYCILYVYCTIQALTRSQLERLKGEKDYEGLVASAAALDAYLARRLGVPGEGPGLEYPGEAQGQTLLQNQSPGRGGGRRAGARGGMGIVDFESLVGLFPNEARPSHDGLFQAVEGMQGGCTEGDAERLVKVLDPSRLSATALARVVESDAIPMGFKLSFLLDKHQVPRTVQYCTVLSSVSWRMHVVSTR